MSVIAAALRELMAAGLHGDALVAAIERIEAAQQPAKRARSSGAERTRRWREKASQTVTSDVTASQTVTCDVGPSPPSSPFPPSSSSPTPPLITTPLSPSSPSTPILGRSASRRDPACDQQFEKFWSAYPKRGEHSNPKHPAKLKFEAAIRGGADPATIIAGALAYARNITANGTQPQFVAQAQVWLNQRRWLDYTAAEAAADPPAKTRGEVEAEVIAKTRDMPFRERIQRQKELMLEWESGNANL